MHQQVSRRTSMTRPVVCPTATSVVVHSKRSTSFSSCGYRISTTASVVIRLSANVIGSGKSLFSRDRASIVDRLRASFVVFQVLLYLSFHVLCLSCSIQRTIFWSRINNELLLHCSFDVLFLSSFRIADHRGATSSHIRRSKYSHGNNIEIGHARQGQRRHVNGNSID
jgi:hypothetical protein